MMSAKANTNALSLRQRVFAVLDKLGNPDPDNSYIYNAFPNEKPKTLRGYKTAWKKHYKQSQTSAPAIAAAGPQHPQQNSTQTTQTQQKYKTPEQLIKIAQYTAQCQNVCENWRPSDTINFFKAQQKIEQQEQKNTKNPIILYRRPAEFHDKQHEIVDSILDDEIKVLFVEGCQRSGKSTSIFAGLHELTATKPRPLRMALMAGKGGNSKKGGSGRILDDICNDQIIQKQNAQMLDYSSKTNDSIKWKKGDRLVAHELTIADIKGADNEVVWIDELDVAIGRDSKARKAVVSAIITMRQQKDFKLILSANMDKGIYMILRNEVEKAQIKGVKFMQIYQEDCPHLMNAQTEHNDEIIALFSDTLMADGGSLTKMRLKNQYDPSGDTFEPSSLMDAVETYDLFMAADPKLLYNIMTIDPSNLGHPFGIFIGGYNPITLESAEIFSTELYLGTDQNDYIKGKVSGSKLLNSLWKWVNDYHVKEVIVEPNSAYGMIVSFLKAKGVKCWVRGWGGKQTLSSHSNYIWIARYLLDERKTVFKNSKLQFELINYDPAKDKEQHKGDLADAYLMFLWEVVGGVKFVKKMLKAKSRAASIR